MAFYENLVGHHGNQDPGLVLPNLARSLCSYSKFIIDFLDEKTAVRNISLASGNSWQLMIGYSEFSNYPEFV